MKKLFLGIAVVILVLGLMACGTNEESNVKPNEESHVEPNVIPNETEEKVENEVDVAKASLIAGGEWKPTSGQFSDEEGMITEMTPTTIYGKYGEVGGATFHEDGTFTKFIGVFEGEEPADRYGTYSIDTDNHSITLTYSRGEVVEVEYDYDNEGKVMYFIYPEENVFVRFDPTYHLSLKNNDTEATYQIEVAMKNFLQETFGSDITDTKIQVTKIYSPFEEQEIEPLKEMNLGDNEVAFEVKYELKPAEGVDVMKFTAATGEYDETDGWVKEKFNLGILRPNNSSEAKYKITDFGTGW